MLKALRRSVSRCASSRSWAKAASILRASRAAIQSKSLSVGHFAILHPDDQPYCWIGAVEITKSSNETYSSLAGAQEGSPPPKNVDR